jgi:hypothetical protein
MPVHAPARPSVADLEAVRVALVARIADVVTRREAERRRIRRRRIVGTLVLGTVFAAVAAAARGFKG